MPELPEVEVVKLFLEDRLLGRKIKSISILNQKSFIGDPKDVIGKRISKFTRIGKQLSIHLDSGLILLIHLKMTGQLIMGDTMLGHPTKFDKYPNQSTRLVFGFDNSTTLFFNDQRKFGWVQVFTPDNLKGFQKNLGLDIFDPEFTPDYFYQQLQRSSRPIKTVLLDQNFFAGIGNIYANDALFLSDTHPTTPANQVKHSSVLVLHRSIVSIMQQSILAGGSTMKDNKYLRPDGTVGSHQFSFQVYQRQGEPCPKCSRPIKRISLGGRGTFFCPHCQPLTTK